jgi:hypothetical protein
MYRKVSEIKRFFLCQTADWQSVVFAEDEEQAATIAIEFLMRESFKKDFDPESDTSDNVSAALAVRMIPQNLFVESKIETKFFYTPMLMADAGFHSEAKRLDFLFKEKIESENLN